MRTVDTAFSDLRSLLFFCVKNAVFSRKCDPWVVSVLFDMSVVVTAVWLSQCLISVWLSQHPV